MPPLPDNDLYALRGVSSQKEDVHHAIKHLSKGLFPNAFCQLYPDVFTGDTDHAVVFHSDTAGTKPILAYLLWKETGLLDGWKSVVQDALVMNTDDMACVGITDTFLVSATFSRNKHLIDGTVVEAVINEAQHLARKWAEHGITLQLMGGETADVGDVIRTADVGYAVAGRIRRDEVIENRFEAGNVIVGLGSFGQTDWETEPNSGIGCNGLTSARHDLLAPYYGTHFPETFDPHIAPVAYLGKYRLTDLSPEGTPIWKLLLSPTRTFLPFLKPILPDYRKHIKGIIHATGGGQTKCLKFANGVHIIKDNLFDPPEVFKLIQAAASQTEEREMYRTFNMGCRLEIYTEPSIASEIVSRAASVGLPAQIIGRVEASDKTQLTIERNGNRWNYE